MRVKKRKEMEYTTDIFKKKINKDDYSYFVLGADLGGTNANFAIAGIRKNEKDSDDPLDLIFAMHFPSKKLRSIIPAFQEVLSEAKKNYGIAVNQACIGAAGPSPVDASFVKMTNAGWNIDARLIIKNTSLRSVLLINDFQALGFALNRVFKNPALAKKTLFTAQKGSRSKADNERGTKAILGGGTGLGSCTLVYDEYKKTYKAINNELSQVDFPARNQEEVEFIKFATKNRFSPLTLDEIISGRGIVSIYEFLRDKRKYPTTGSTKEISRAIPYDKPALISKYKNKDRTCKETFRIFAWLYGRTSKNFVLNTMAFGGLYIAGGIAAKNLDLFRSKEFKTEFVNTLKYAKLLKTIAIYVVKDYDISLYGVCYAAMQTSK